MERQKTTKDIGTIEGKLLVFGGVYSNLQALEALKKVADQYGFAPGSIICTGDVVGYCAQPEESVQLIKNWGIHCIAGNVEIQLRERQEDCGCDFNEDSRCDIFSRNWYTYAQRNVSEPSLQWMETLPDYLTFNFGDKKSMVVHGSYFGTSDFIFKSTPEEVKQKSFDATNTGLILAGHCGLPFADRINNKLWLNAGVIGMPANDADRRVWYATLEIKDSIIEYEFHRLEYDNETTARLMHENKLPQQYAKTILDGVWDNCEILPETETAEQGQPIIIE